MLKPIWLPNKLFYSKARLNIEPFKKILKIKNKYRVAVQLQSIKKFIKPNKKKRKKEKKKKKKEWLTACILSEWQKASCELSSNYTKRL